MVSFGRIDSRILKIPIEHEHPICSLESGLSFDYICSVEIFDNIEVIVKILTASNSPKA